MLDFNTLAEFSRAHCISICAFLVPANLVATAVSIILVVLGRPLAQVWQPVVVGSIFALVMVLHVWTWFLIGVVMAPTYILLWLGATCLIANLVAVVFRTPLANAWKHWLQRDKKIWKNS